MTDDRGRTKELGQRISTVACRPCHSGWYGQEGDRCPKCKGEVVVTDTYTTIELRTA